MTRCSEDWLGFSGDSFRILKPMNASSRTRDSDWRPIHGLLFVVLLAAATYVPAFRFWPLLFLVPLAAYAMVVAIVPGLRASFRPWRFGRVSKVTIGATLVIAAGSCAALVAFRVLTHPDLGAFRGFLPVSALGGMWAAGFLFAAFNALFEEIIFRGIVFDAVESQWGARVGVVASAALFAYGHQRGYPSGLLGVMLAGIYGICLGWLRVVTGGLGLPVLAHVVADATIFILISRSGIL